jgi:hypothetical protein
MTITLVFSDSRIMRYIHTVVFMHALQQSCSGFAASREYVDTGARKVEQVIEQHILPELSAELLARNVEGEPVSRVVIDWDPRGGFVYDFDGDQTSTDDDVVVQDGIVDESANPSLLILGDPVGLLNVHSAVGIEP